MNLHSDRVRDVVIFAGTLLSAAVGIVARSRREGSFDAWSAAEYLGLLSIGLIIALAVAIRRRERRTVALHPRAEPSGPADRDPA